MRNHNSATYYSLTGHAPPLDDIRLRDTQELYPAYGSTVAKLAPVEDPAIPTFVSFPHVLRDGSVTPGQHASFLGKAFDPFFIGQDPEPARLPAPRAEPAGQAAARPARRPPRPAAADRRADRPARAGRRRPRGSTPSTTRALTMLASPKVKQAFDLSQEPDRLRDDYGRTTYGQSCLLARRLVEAGVRFVTVYYSPSIGGKGSGGWDTHGDNFNQLKNRLLPITDQTVPTLIDDLDARGLLDETLVVWMGEFGRSPKVDEHQAVRPRRPRPLAQCYTVLFAGGGIDAGRDLRLQRPARRLPGHRPGHARRHRRHHVLGPRHRPRHRGPRHPQPPLPIAAGKPITAIFSDPSRYS